MGCGTGALTQSILARTSPHQVTGIDPSEGFAVSARACTGDPRAAFKVGDARRLPVDTGAFDAAVTGLVLNFVPTPQAVSEMARAVGRAARREAALCELHFHS